MTNSRQRANSTQDALQRMKRHAKQADLFTILFNSPLSGFEFQARTTAGIAVKGALDLNDPYLNDMLKQMFQHITEYHVHEREMWRVMLAPVVPDAVKFDDR